MLPKSGYTRAAAPLWLGGLFIALLWAAPAHLRAQSTENIPLTTVTGGTLTLSQAAAEKKAVVVLFYSNHCVYARNYEERVARLIRRFANEPVAFVLVNANNPRVTPDESVEELKAQLERMGITVPYLVDANRQLAARFAVTLNPEAIILRTNTSGRMTQVYKGRIDDSPLSVEGVKIPNLELAIESTLSGVGVPGPSGATTGCPFR
jgi:peroxiredoxin